MMICINRPETDPYFNIAAEEHILKSYHDDVMMIWQNQPSIIIGKHQNTLAEINYSFLEKNNIPIIRRISGGGTVYHDLNNINYSVIETVERKDRLIDFERFLKPVVDFLRSLGIQANFGGINNLFINNMKISGSSAHVFKKRVLHHGTILFNSNLEFLNRAIHPPQLEIEDKAVQSIRKKVTNVSDHLRVKMNIDKFKVLLKEFMVKYHQINEIKELNKSDIFSIQKLIDDKYHKWEWNFGYSPKYTFRNQMKNTKVRLDVKHGIINNAELVPPNRINNYIATKLINKPHRRSEILHILNSQFDDQNIVENYALLLGI